MRERKLGKLIKKSLKTDHLYTTEELIYMKKELRNLEKISKEKEQQLSKGFGKYDYTSN